MGNFYYHSDCFAAPALITFISGSSESVVIEMVPDIFAGIHRSILYLVFYWFFVTCCRDLEKGCAAGFEHHRADWKIVFVILFIPTLKYFGVIICEPVIWCLMCIQLVISYYRDPYIRGKEEKK